MDYTVWGVATDDDVTKFQTKPAELHANQLLGSAKPGHVNSSERSAAKRLIMVDGYQG